MSEHCVVCGADDVWKRVALPEEWTTYLTDERGLEPAEGYYLLSACDDCGDRVTVHKELASVMDGMDDGTRELLEEVDVDALVEETG